MMKFSSLLIVTLIPLLKEVTSIIETCPQKHLLRLNRAQLSRGKEELATVRIYNTGDTDEYISVWFNDTYQGVESPSSSSAMRTSSSLALPYRKKDHFIPLDILSELSFPSSKTPYTLVVKLRQALPFFTKLERCVHTGFVNESSSEKNHIWSAGLDCTTKKSGLCQFSLKGWGDHEERLYSASFKDCSTSQIIEKIHEYNEALQKLVEAVEIIPHRRFDQQVEVVPSFNSTWEPEDGGDYLKDPYYATSHTLVEADKVWDWLSQYPISESPTVMIIDTYTNLEHPELSSNLLVIPEEVNGRANFDDDGDGTIDNLRGLDGENMSIGDPIPGNDANGHGTAVCAVIAGKPNNGRGGAGLTPNVRILPCGTGGTGMSIGATNNCVQYAAANAKRLKIRVTNHSYGAPGAFESERSAFRELGEAGIISVVATGNSEIDLVDSNNEMVYPFGYSLEGEEFRGMIATPRIDLHGLPAPSGYGLGIASFYMPGSFLIGDKDPSLDSISVAEGTSFSTPAGAALISAMLTVNYKLDVDDVMYLLKMNVRPYEPVAKKCTWGGIGNFPAVMNAAAGSWFKRKDFSPRMEDFLRVPAKESIDIDFKVSLSESQLKHDYHAGNVILYRKDEEKLTGATKIGSIPVELYINQ